MVFAGDYIRWEINMALNAFTDENKIKLDSLESGGGTTERLSTVMSATLVLSGGEQQLAFDPAQTSRSAGFTVNVGGSFTVLQDGYYSGDLSLYVDKSGGIGVDLSIWIEIKPLATGIWQLASTGMSNPIVHDDGGQPVALNGALDVLSGDEVRIMIQENAGTGSLISETKVKSLGSVTDYAASISVYKVGPVTT